MAWSGGNFTRANPTWVSDASAGIGIEAARHDSQDNDFTTGIDQCLNKTGQNAMTGNLNLGGFIPTNIGAGTAAAPALCMNNDTNTGLFSPAADQIGIATNGTEKVRITDTGRVGIGTTAPTSALQVTGAIDGTPDAIGVHIGMVGTSYACLELAASTGGIIDFTEAGVDNKGRIIYTNVDNAMVIATNNAERMRVTGTGRVGIGITPTSFVHIQNNESAAINSLNVTSNVAGDLSTAAAILVKKDNNSTTSQVFAQFLMNGAAAGSGQINANGALQAAFGSYSDERLKENIENLPSQLANIFALRPVEFDYKDGAGHQIGFIAQEVQQIYPDLIGTGADGFLTLSGLGKNEARMIKAFQEFAQLTEAKIAALEARIAALEA